MKQAHFAPCWFADDSLGLMTVDVTAPDQVQKIILFQKNEILEPK